MAYMSQERKKELAPNIKKVLEKYGVKGSISVHHHSTLCVRLKEGKLDFIGNYRKKSDDTVTNGHIQVNQYWAHDHFSGECKEFLEELIAAMNIGNHNRSDSMVDHFDIGWYIDIDVGAYDKPYKVIS